MSYSQNMMMTFTVFNLRQVARHRAPSASISLLLRSTVLNAYIISNGNCQLEKFLVIPYSMQYHQQDTSFQKDRYRCKPFSKSLVSMIKMYIR